MTRTFRWHFDTVSYTLTTGRNRVRVSLKVRPDGSIRVSAPTGYPLKSADRLVADHMTQIARARESFARALREMPDTLLLEGRRLPLRAQKGDKARVCFAPDAVTVICPDPDAEKVRQLLRKELSARALMQIRQSIDRWGPTVPMKPGRLTIREQKSRWGSLSSAGNLSFHWKLIMAPPEALEYVVIHELSHFLHFNHSARFWAEVEKRMPDYRVWKQWLKQNGALLKL